MESPRNNEVNMLTDEGNNIQIAIDSVFTYRSKITA